METKEQLTPTGLPAKKRDLSVRYGKHTSPDDSLVQHSEDVIPPIGQKHPLFLVIASFAFACLYAELVFFGATYYGNKLDGAVNVAAIVGVFGLMFGAVYASFTLPHRYYRARFQDYSPIIFLVVQWTMSILMLLGANIITLVVGIFLVDGRLEAVGEVLRSLALYSIVAIIVLHGLVIYVRYVRFLYERDMHESYKIVSVAGASSVILMIVTLYLLQFDLGRMGGTMPNQGWLSLHLSIRDVTLLATTIYVFIWHATVLADH